DSEDDYEAAITHNAPSFVQPTKQVKTPRSSVTTIETSISADNHKTAIPKPKSNGNRRNRKACFVCKSLDHLIKDYDFYEKKMAQTPVRNHAQRENHQQYARMTLQNPQRHVVPTAVLTKSKLVSITAARLVTAVVPKPHVTSPRQAKTVVTKPHSPPKRTINHSPSPKASTFPLKVTAAKAPMISDSKDENETETKSKQRKPSFAKIEFAKANEQVKSLRESVKQEEHNKQAKHPRKNSQSPRGLLSCECALLKIFDTGLALFTVGLGAIHSLSCKRKELLIVDALGDPKGGKITSKDKITTGTTCLFAKATLDESNLWNRRLGYRNFKTMNKLSEVHVSPSNSAHIKKHDDKTKREAKGKSHVESSTGYRNLSAEFEDFSDNSINEINAADSLVPVVGQISTNSTNTFSTAGPSNTIVIPTHEKSSYVDTSQLPDDPNMPELEDITYSDDEEDVGAEADFTNLETTITVSHIPTTRVHKDHPVTQIISDLSSATQTKSVTRVAKDQGGLSQINNDDFHTCMFVCFLSQEEPKRGYRHQMGFRSKKDERGIVVRNKARLVAQGHTQDEGIDYEEVFALVSRIEAIRLFLAYTFFMGFMVYQMDVKSAFLYGTIKEEDPDYPDKVYKVVKALYGLHQAPRAWYETLANYLLENGFQRGKIDQTLFIKRQKGYILLV
nr:hypothetical protein [Tanacetum cinerariifolium]